MRINKIVSLSVVILLITVVFAGAVPAAAQNDTMQFRYNAQHTGDYSPVAGSVPSNGQLLWNYTTNGSVSSSPTVANGVVYVGSDDNNVYALNATTGASVWNYTTGSSVESSPAVVNGVVYVGSDDYNVYALYANNGTKLWNYTTGGAVTSSPAVANGVVFVGSNDHDVYALYANNGTKFWNYTTGGRVVSSPAVGNNVIEGSVVYVGSEDTNVYGLNATTGAEVWNFTDGSPVDSSPAFDVANGTVYVGFADGFVWAVDAIDGGPGWYAPPFGVNGGVYSSPAFANGVVYVEGVMGNVYAVTTFGGFELWTTMGGGGTSSAAVANGVVYIGTGWTTSALNATNGHQLWSFTTGGYVESSPAVANGVVYVGSDDGNVYAIGNSTTTLTATAPSAAPVSQNFTINGTLSGSTFGLAGATITLQRSTDNVTYTNVTTNVTDANGTYQFSKNESAAGTYYYRTTYDGDASYNNATSNIVSVNVTGPPTTPTTLTATAPSTAYVTRNFTINGTLAASDGTRLPFATITLQSNASGTWNNVTTTSTDAAGNYQFSNNESSAGTYYYQTIYAGSASYANATSNTVSVQVTTIPTQLSAAANLTSVAINAPFTVNGTLNTTDGAAIAGATVQLQKNLSGTWTNVTGETNITDSNGAYSISTSESAAGTYQYRAFYAGNDTYSNATSNTVTVAVSRGPTTLNATISSKFVSVNKRFTINGTLSSGTTGLAGATITLQRSTNNATWNTVTTTTTNAAGQYQFSWSESSTGTYYYRTAYGGNATYINATSNVVSVKVVSKASVLADLNALQVTVMGISSSSFTPGTKVATLAVISAAEVNHRVGNPGAAATELKALLPHMSGCSATGKPNSNDWVRTCAAQAQLFPQVQNLIQELQALQGT